MSKIEIMQQLNKKDVKVAIDIYMDAPFSLIGRIKSKCIFTIDNRLQVLKGQTILVNIPIDSIENISCETYDLLQEIRFDLSGTPIKYKIAIMK